MRHPLPRLLPVVALLASSAALADPVITQANIDFTAGSTSFGYLGQQFTFSDLTRYFFDTDPIAVTTTAHAAVTAFGLPFYDPPQPTTFFDPIRGDGELTFDGGYLYTSFQTATRIPTSLFPSIIGLALTLDDGIHYGFARFENSFLSSYGFESAPGVGITVTNVVAVPEPETWALMFAGLGVLGAVARRRTSGGRVIA